MLAESIGKPNDIYKYIDDENYAIEQKMDGHRILIRIDEGRITEVWNRKGERSQHYQTMTSSSWQDDVHPLGSLILDGELIGDKLYCFDMPYLVGTISLHTAHHYRKLALDLLFEHLGGDEASNHLKRVNSAVDKDEKLKLVVRCHQQKAEGVVIKDRNAPYVQEKTDKMLKMKFTSNADVVIIGTGIKGKESASLGVYNMFGELKDIGRCSLIGKEEVVPGDVIEVEYLYATDKLRLVQARMKFKREDKTPLDCHISQIKISNSKEVVNL